MSDSESKYGRWVEVSFDCLPLRTVARFDVPDDASPKLAAKMLRIRQAVEKHGVHNTYYLHNSACVYHLTNSPTEGMLHYGFEGVVLTDEKDLAAKSCDIEVELIGETCSWINQPIVAWMQEAVRHAVLVEFGRYIEQGDLSKTLERIDALQKDAEESGGYLGMYL